MKHEDFYVEKHWGMLGIGDMLGMEDTLGMRGALEIGDMLGIGVCRERLRRACVPCALQNEKAPQRFRCRASWLQDAELPNKSPRVCAGAVSTYIVRG